MKFRKKAVIYDLDGVLCSTDRFHYMAWKQLADRLGIYFDEEINNRLRGVSRMASLEIILQHTDQSYTAEEKLSFTEEKNEIYRNLLSTMTPNDLSDEVRNTLFMLREKGFSQAVGSSSKNTKYILERIGLSDFFDAIADGTDITHSKPDPEVFLAAAKKLEIPPESCVVVEDAKAGIQAAKAGGITAFALYGDARACGLEDYDLDTFADLTKILVLA